MDQLLIQKLPIYSIKHVIHETHVKIQENVRQLYGTVTPLCIYSIIMGVISSLNFGSAPNKSQ